MLCRSMDAVSGFLSDLGPAAYVAIGLLTFLEASAFVGLVVPGETAVVLGGFLAAQGEIAPGGVFAAASLGAALGDTVGYELGRHLGRRLLDRYRGRSRIRRGNVARAERLFAHWGGAAVFFGRFVAFLRAFAPFVAGMSRMPYVRFVLCNVAGGAVWAAACTALGYFAGAHWWALERWMGRGGLAVAAIVAVGLWLVVRRRRARAPKPTA